MIKESNLILARASFYGILTGSLFGLWQNNAFAGMTLASIIYIKLTEMDK